MAIFNAPARKIVVAVGSAFLVSDYLRRA